MNSGLAKYTTTFGNDPFSNIGNLTWLENPIAINNPDGSGNTSLCMAAKTRLESGVTYVYAVFDNAKVSKIQVNDPTSKNPNYDIATLLSTITVDAPTFQYGSSIQFYGSTEKLFIGHDNGVTKMNFDGTGQATVGVSASYVNYVPRPSANFLGKLYFGNGNNLAEIDSTETVTTYAKLSPALPTGMYVRDLDVSPDGNYLQIIASRSNSPILDSNAQDTNSLSSTDSYKFLWNGTDTGITSYHSYNGYSLTSNTTFGPHTYMLGYDLGGAAIYESNQKIVTLPNSTSPNFGAMFSTGNLLGFAAPEYVSANSNLQASIMFYGQYDQETPKGLFRFLRYAAQSASMTDVSQMPVCLTVSNLFYGSAFAAYSGNLVGAAKIYFSVLENNLSGGVSRKLYKFTTVPTGLGTAIGGVYETQQETSIRLFRNILKKKLKVSEVRIFCPAFVANNSFKIDLIGSGGIIANSSYTFTVGSTLTAGQTLAKYNPQIDAQYSVGIRITNLGTANFVIEKIELDIDEQNA